MNLQAEKLEVLKLLLETDNPSILSSIKKLLKREAKADFWDTLSAAQKEEILQGMAEIDRGEVVEYEDFRFQNKSETTDYNASAHFAIS
jgi:predicted Zn-ribbon and HTH transcriptional regulator